MIAGGLAAAWALLVGVAIVTCLVMLAWAVSPNSAGDSAAAWRAAGLTWLGAHLVPLQVSGEPVTLLPIGGLLLGLLLTRRSGAWTGRLLPEPSGGEVAGLLVGAALIYGAGGAGLAWLSASESASAVPARAFLVTGLVAAAGTTWGIWREADLGALLRGRLTDAAWRTVAAGLAATVGLFCAGSVLVTASLVRHYGEVAATLADVDAGVIGAAGVTLLGALALPNLAIWAMAVLAGPGFHVGGIGALSAFDGKVDSLPALPVLAAIPTTAPAWAPALLLVPVALGVLAGRIRWGRDLPTATGALVAALGLGGVVAALVAGLGWLASGSLGGGRLDDVGPLLLPVTAAATGLVLLGFLVEAGFQSVRLSWELHRAEQRALALRAGAAAPDEAQGEPAAGADPADGAARGSDEAVDEAPPDPGARPSRGPGAVAVATGRISGAGSAVTTRVAGAGASAVSVVSGAGGALLAGVGAIGSGAAARVAGAGAAVAGSVRGRSAAPGQHDVVDVRAEEESIDLRDDPVADTGTGDAQADAGDPAAEAADRAIEPDGSAADQGEVDDAEADDAEADDAEADDAEVDDAMAAAAVEDVAAAGHAPQDGADAEVEGPTATPATGWGDDDTAEIPIIVSGQAPPPEA
jgi:hypothetical protein